MQDLADNLNRNEQVDGILLNFSKAFDKVSHQRLVEKLSYYRVRGNLHSWIKDFLTNRKQEVVLEGKHSSRSEVTSGVPQGTVLGPLPFLIFINNITKNTSSNVRLFADDFLLYHTRNCEADAITLQKDIDIMQQWEAKWLMEFKPDKCEVITITNKRSHINYPYNIHGKELVHVYNMLNIYDLLLVTT